MGRAGGEAGPSPRSRRHPQRPRSPPRVTGALPAAPPAQPVVRVCPWSVSPSRQCWPRYGRPAGRPVRRCWRRLPAG